MDSFSEMKDNLDYSKIESNINETVLLNELDDEIKAQIYTPLNPDTESMSKHDTNQLLFTLPIKKRNKPQK